jgi:hypothetical protein
MNYTHFWKLRNHQNIVIIGHNYYQFNPISPDQITDRDQHNFSIAFDICLQIIPNYVQSLNLCGPFGEDSPIFENDTIQFNGSKHYNQAGEPFVLYRSLYDTFRKSFCNTRKQPYDFPVVLCLWICSKVCDAFIFESEAGSPITKDDYTSEFIRDDMIEFIYDDEYMNLYNEDEYKLIKVHFKDIHGNIEKIFELM